MRPDGQEAPGTAHRQPGAGLQPARRRSISAVAL